MTTEELLQLIKRTVQRHELAEAYAEALKVENREKVDWAKVNAAIKKKWSRATLIHIKEVAWQIYEMEHKRRPGVECGGDSGVRLGVEGDHSDAIHERE